MTDVALKEYLETQIRALRDHVEIRDIGGQRALELATRGLHDRFEQVNQFREQVLSERSVYARHDFVSGLEKRVAQLELAAANALGRWWTIGLVASGLGAGLGLIVSRLIGR